MANSPFGIFSYGARIEKSLDHLPLMVKVLWRSLLERKQFLSSSALVQVGKNTQIDPAAIIQGPTIIGNNVTIGPGAVINASIIGNNVQRHAGRPVDAQCCWRWLLPAVSISPVHDHVDGKLNGGPKHLSPDECGWP